MPRRATPQTRFSDIAELRRFLKDSVADTTWRRLAERKFDNRVAPGTLHRIANDENYEPQTSTLRSALGLPCYAPALVCSHCGNVPLAKRCPCTRKPSAAPRVNWKKAYMELLDMLIYIEGKQ